MYKFIHLQRSQPSHTTMKILGAATMAAISAVLSSLASAQLQEVPTLTVAAPLFDARTSNQNGCDPNGCIGANTIDGDATDENSRWSCRPVLGGSTGSCSITYTLDETSQIFTLNIAMYKGDTRTRTLDIYVDDVLETTWTSSGTTTDFETVKLGFFTTDSTSGGGGYDYSHVGVAGSKVELVGDLVASEWLSILEVAILVGEGGTTPTSTTTSTSTSTTTIPPLATPTPAPVFAPVATVSPTVPTPEQLYSAKEIGTIGIVTATANLYDTRLDGVGCGPNGCMASLTRDGDLSPVSRWSCRPGLSTSNEDCAIVYDLAEEYSFEAVRVSLYQGTTRTRTLDVYVDGVLVRTWESSGTTDDFESIDLTGNDGQLLVRFESGQVLELSGYREDSEWISILETEILVYPKYVVTPPPASTPATAPAPATLP